MTKQQLRAQLKKERASITETQRMIWNEKLAWHLMTWEPFQKAQQIMIYLSIGWEIDTWGMVEELSKRGTEIYVPVVQKKPKRLVATRYLAKEQLVPGDFGILEPAPGALTVDPAHLDLVIVPGLAFTPEGYRLGYGGGYYDRFLLTTPALKVGLCYTAFLRDLPLDEWDQPVDFLGTEEGIRGRK